MRNFTCLRLSYLQNGNVFYSGARRHSNPWEERVGGNSPAQNTPFTPLRKIRTRTCWFSRSWARASSSWRGQRPYSQTPPSPSLATPWRTLSHLTDKDVPQGISGMRSVHQNFSDSCKGQAALSERGGPAQSETEAWRQEA